MSGLKAIPMNQHGAIITAHNRGSDTAACLCKRRVKLTTDLVVIDNGEDFPSEPY